MKKIFLLICCSISTFSFATNTDKDQIIELAKLYNKYMLVNEPSSGLLRKTRLEANDPLKATVKFITEACATNNKLLDKTFLTSPDDASLKSIWLVRKLYANLRDDNPKDNIAVYDSLSRLDIARVELLDNYYATLFVAAGNKNKPFDMSEINFTPKDYKLTSETEAGIFFLRCMNACNSQVWGYINVAKPMNTSKAYAEIRKFPRFNGQPYYQYNDFTFPDFKMVINTDDGLESYKQHFLNKYYELLLYHFVCLKKEGGTEEELQELQLGSILRDRRLYKYTVYKSDLEDMFYAVLQFDKRNIDCEDKWVAYPKDSNGVYSFGFVYIDEEAGLTYNFGGNFTVSDDGSFNLATSKALEKVSLKARLEPGKGSRMAIIPEEKFASLKIEKIPDWLKFYKTNEDSIAHLFKWGFTYNMWDKPDKAMNYLQRAAKKDAHYKGLALELAYAHNALEQFDQALQVLNSSPEAKSDRCYYYKEYSYAQMHLGQIDKAESTLNEAFGACDNDGLKGEMAYNLAYQFYKQKNIEKFRKWAAEVKKRKVADDYLQNLEKMEASLDNK